MDLDKAWTQILCNQKRTTCGCTFCEKFLTLPMWKRVVVRTDHSSLKWFFQFKNPETADSLVWNPECPQTSNTAQTGSSTQEWRCIKSYSMSPVCFPVRLNIHQSEIRTINENKVKTKDKDIPSSSLREKQDKDINVSLIKKNWIKESTRPNLSKIKGRGYVLQSLWSQWNRLTVQNDMLYRKFEDNDGKPMRLLAEGTMTIRFLGRLLN